MADLLALVRVVYCDFVHVTFPFGILGQGWCLIVSIPDPRCLFYFYMWQLLGGTYLQSLISSIVTELIRAVNQGAYPGIRERGFRCVKEGVRFEDDDFISFFLNIS